MGEEQQFTSVYGLKHVVSKHAGKLHLPIPNAPLYKKPYHNFPFPSFTLRSLSFNYSNKYIPNIQYVTLKYMK